MTTLLHIGHNKTGSSAIQSFLALNAGRLEAFGWTYPDDPGLAAARAGEISIGNLGAFRQFTPGTASGNTLFSSELLFFSLAGDSEDFEQLLALGPDCRVLIFTRDLFGYLLSHWGQEIKRGGVTAGVVETVLKERIYAKLLTLLARFDDHGIAYRVRNYSPHSRDIFRAFLSELMPGQEAAFLEGAASPSHLVNRGLTLAEYEVQRLFNLYLPRVTTFPFVSDRVVNELPDIPSERPVLPDDVVGEVQRQNEADAEVLNALLPPLMPVSAKSPMLPLLRSQARIMRSRRNLCIRGERSQPASAGLEGSDSTVPAVVPGNRKASAPAHGRDTLRASRSSARVRPRLTAAIGLPRCAARRTKRNPE